MRSGRRVSHLPEEDEGEQALERMEWLADLKRQGRHEKTDVLVQLREQQVGEDKITSLPVSVAAPVVVATAPFVSTIEQDLKRVRVLWPVTDAEHCAVWFSGGLR